MALVLHHIHPVFIPRLWDFVIPQIQFCTSRCILFIVFALRIYLLESAARGIAENACEHTRLMRVFVFWGTLYWFTSLTVDIESRKYGLFN